MSNHVMLIGLALWSIFVAARLHRHGCEAEVSSPQGQEDRVRIGSLGDHVHGLEVAGDDGAGRRVMLYVDDSNGFCGISVSDDAGRAGTWWSMSPDGDRSIIELGDSDPIQRNLRLQIRYDRDRAIGAGVFGAGGKLFAGTTWVSGQQQEGPELFTVGVGDGEGFRSGLVSRNGAASFVVLDNEYQKQISLSYSQADGASAVFPAISRKK